MRTLTQPVSFFQKITYSFKATVAVIAMLWYLVRKVFSLCFKSLWE